MAEAEDWKQQRRGVCQCFVTASLTVSIGAMAIVGSIQDGLLHDYSTLAVKSVLDFIIIAVMTSSMGADARFLPFLCLRLKEALHCWPGYCRRL